MRHDYPGAAMFKLSPRRLMWMIVIPVVVVMLVLALRQS
jgi:hypothetical protein